MDKKPESAKTDAVSNEELDQYLEGGSPVSQSYQAMGASEPPAALDRAIRQEAHDAVARDSKEKRHTFWQSWTKPLGSIVAMGFCLAIVLRIMNYDTTLSESALELEEDAALFATVPQKEKRAAAEPKAELDALMRERAEPPRPAAATRKMAPQRSGDVGQAYNAPLDLDLADKRSLEQQALMSMAEERIVASKQVAAKDSVLADDAVLAWNSGAKPAAAVWLTGIDAVYGAANPQAADELNKVARVYPGAAGPAEAAPTQQRLMQDSIDERAALTDIADPVIWAAGIKALTATGDTEAAADELQKFRLVYPAYELPSD